METVIRNLCLEISRDGGLSVSEYRVVAYLLGIVPANLHVQIGHQEVAEALGMARPQVSRAMRRLENKRYLTKLANRLYKFPDRLKAQGARAAQTNASPSGAGEFKRIGTG